MSHTAFMDDIKAVTTPEGLDTVLDKVETVVESLGGELNLTKCGRAGLKKGEPVEPSVESRVDTVGPQKKEMPLYGPGSLYRYLGIQQLYGTAVGVLKKEVTHKFVARLKQIWGSELNLQNKVAATNQCCLALLRYYFIGSSWTKQNLTDLDRIVRRTLGRYQCWYYEQAIQRLYMPREKGGLGLISPARAQQQFVLSLAHYLEHPPDTFVAKLSRHIQEMSDIRQNVKTNVLYRATELRKKYGIAPTLNPNQANNTLAKNELEALKAALEAKSVHGRYQKFDHGKYSNLWLAMEGFEAAQLQSSWRRKMGLHAPAGTSNTSSAKK